MNKFYIDTRALGRGFVLNEVSGFFGREVPGLPEEAAEAIKDLQSKWQEVQRWLDFTYVQCSRKDYDPVLPDHLRSILCLEEEKEEKPVRKATAAASSKKSQKPSTKTKSATSTKTPKAS